MLGSDSEVKLMMMMTNEEEEGADGEVLCIYMRSGAERSGKFTSSQKARKPN